MFSKNLERLFLAVILIALLVLVKNYYDGYTFKINDIPDSYKQRIANKEQEVIQLMQSHYGFSFRVPIIITDRFKGRLYGITAYKDGEIKIYLNKKVMQESMDYMVDSVIAHEYAHALIFKLGIRDRNKDSHSKEWQQACVNLGGLNCEQYVNSQDVVMGKLPF
ncbi:SprT-like domain-containing protein [Sulfurimonas sp. CS5]|jgi:predicted SprT family Zn-dependent metalloprotease|uniref:SprT-like domain-containing protein n=1 Tax=Sulfurimonas sp. CS5 TaxID=3391145 RepID=UPI0039E7A50E